MYCLGFTFDKIYVMSFLFQGICDGAAALVLASEEAVKVNNLTPLARLVSYGISGEAMKIIAVFFPV